MLPLDMRMRRGLGLRFQAWRERLLLLLDTAAATVIDDQQPPAGGGGGVVEVVGGGACYEAYDLSFWNRKGLGQSHEQYSQQGGLSQCSHPCVSPLCPSPGVLNGPLCSYVTATVPVSDKSWLLDYSLTTLTTLANFLILTIF